MVSEVEHHEINIGIIGAGEVGAELLRIFIDLDFINVKQIADIDLTAPGIELAQEVGVNHTTEMMDIINDRQIDLIVEVTNSDQVLAKVKENMRDEQELISGESSYLLYYIIEMYKRNQHSLLESVTTQLTGIYNSIDDNSLDISNSINQVEQVTKNLNILAINASIEAARAGKEGRGFSVVANEVKELAEESQGLVQNIEEINQNIIKLNQEINQAVSNLEGKMSKDI
ncbi:methyl-accepting chemotaxis protein [Natroniella sulfidigena]|uniref:methyl-accepting chemotaxis protein n=1 Tax=Natroniella sulfidigena TaxID=723921 RepID=UPI00200A5B27|nr:methyl-accepting chemotaxis protein [Natroniella sulfidigena]MCK8817473.1 methyl-accepting chemotaxis protein [Natroniella sulfidigena]